MAVTSNQLEQLVTSSAGVPFRQRIEFNLVLTAENVASEAPATARHAQRAALASQIINNPDQFTTSFAQAVVAQLPLSTTNMVAVSGVPNADVDTTDATLANTISAVWNDFLPQPP